MKRSDERHVGHALCRRGVSALARGASETTCWGVKPAPETDLIIRKSSTEWDDNVYLITKIVGDTYHIHKQEYTLHARHLASYFSPLEQEKK